jgi:CheY-like chemotaxis protein
VRNDDAQVRRSWRARRSQPLVADTSGRDRPVAPDTLDVRAPDPPIDLTFDHRLDERPRVLIVDDEPDVRDWLRIALHQDGWNVNAARSAAEGAEMADRLHPQVVLLDQQLPDGPGLECGRWLREHHPEIRVVMFSAYLDIKTEEDAFALGISTISKVDHVALLTTMTALREGMRRRVEQRPTG